MFKPEKLRSLREERKMSRDTLAHEIRARGTTGTTARGIAFWEQGTHSPSGDVIPLIAASLGVDIAELFTDDEQAASDDEEAAPVSDDLYDQLTRVLREIVEQAMAGAHA